MSTGPTEAPAPPAAVDDRSLAQTMGRLALLIRAADPTGLRLLACAVTADALPLFQACHLDDHRSEVAIETARRYAAGSVTERERDAAAALMSALVAALADDPTQRVPFAVAKAASSCLWKDPRAAVRAVYYWVAAARGEECSTTDYYARQVDALEAVHRR